MLDSVASWLGLGGLFVLIIILAASVWSLRRKLEREVMPKPLALKKRFLKALHGKPIVPQHQPPAEISGILVTDDDRVFFEDFRKFGEIFNEGEADPEFGSAWRIQELHESELKNAWRDSPAYGRCYDVFYNQMVVGRLELFPSPSYSFDAERPKTIYADLKLDYVRRVSFDSLYGFLATLRDFMTNDRDNAVIDRALLSVLWDALHISQFPDLDGLDDGDIDVRFEGTAPYYFHCAARREAIR